MSPDDVPEVNLSEFATLIGLEQIASGRYSGWLAANFLGGALSGVQNPAKIVHEIASAHPACPSAQELIEYFRTV